MQLFPVEKAAECRSLHLTASQAALYISPCCLKCCKLDLAVHCRLSGRQISKSNFGNGSVAEIEIPSPVFRFVFTSITQCDHFWAF